MVFSLSSESYSPQLFMFYGPGAFRSSADAAFMMKNLAEVWKLIILSLFNVGNRRTYYLNEEVINGNRNETEYGRPGRDLKVKLKGILS